MNPQGNSYLLAGGVVLVVGDIVVDALVFVACGGCQGPDASASRQRASERLHQNRRRGTEAS